MNCNHDLVWHNCYKSGFDLISPDSFAHPAKMSASLCYRILDHLKELGLLNDSDTILDPMSGTGLTAICANAKGYRAVTVELEEKFCNFQRENKEYAGRKLCRELDWTILQGDARKLSKLLTERGLVTVSSPPYQEAGDERRYGGLKDPTSIMRPHTECKILGYSEGQIGNLPDKPLKTVISPPYDGQVSASNSDPHPEMQMSTPAGRQYGHADGQIGDTQSESYLEAMRQVYSEIAKVSDVLAIVLKNPTRKGKLRRLDLDSISLLEQTGWTIHCQHQALLFEELEREDMFSGPQKKLKGRVSFFKLLSYKKGNVIAQWEDILFAVKKDSCVPIEKIANARHLPITTILENIAASTEANLTEATSGAINKDRADSTDNILRTTQRPLGLSGTGRIFIDTDRTIPIKNTPDIVVEQSIGDKLTESGLTLTPTRAKTKRNHSLNHVLRADCEHKTGASIPLGKVNVIDGLIAANFVSKPDHYLLINQKQLNDMALSIGANISISREQSEKICFGLRINRVKEGFIVDVCSLVPSGNTVRPENTLVSGDSDIVIGHQNTRSYAFFVSGTELTFLLNCKSAINESPQAVCHFNSNYTIKPNQAQVATKNGGGNLKAVTSPPYESMEIAITSQGDKEQRKQRRADGTWEGYGDTPGQIGKLKDR